MIMSGASRPTGHLQVKTDRSGSTRSYWAVWRDHSGARGGRRLGPAHVRDSGRRTPRGAIIWRAGDGPRPTPAHLTPKDAQARLDAILDELVNAAATPGEPGRLATLFDATQGWVVERTRDKGLKRTTLAGYEILFERLYRDLGADTPVRDFADGRLREYFDDFKSYKVVNNQTALRARKEGKTVKYLVVERWTAQPASSLPVEVTTKAEAVRLADELPGTWHHLRRGTYRVVPLDAQRARSVTYQQAMALEAEGWVVERRKKRLWTIVGSAATSTRNEYRDVFAACLNYAVRQRWIQANPLAEVKRRSNRAARERVLRRDDFYDPDEVATLLSHAPDVFHEAFWLCGAHAGLRLPGEALGIRWGAVDFRTGILRPYDNWVREQLDTTKTADSEAIPMTPRLTRALRTIKRRGYSTSDADFVFIDRLDPSHPVSHDLLRTAFHRTRKAAGLKPLRMYNLRHSFGTSLASNGVDIRTIQGLMRHKHLNTTEQYVAYSPRPELANQIARALDPRAVHESAVTTQEASGGLAAAFLERLEEEIPAKWAREVRRLYAETWAEPTNW